MPDRKRVWLLGAGFSRSLGGPLMGDLLSLSARRRLMATYANQIPQQDIDFIFWLYHCGAGFPEGPIDPDLVPRGDRRWGDAEQFLETLDAARSDHQKVLVIDQVHAAATNVPVGLHPIGVTRYPGVFYRTTRSTPNELASMATRIVAASCSAFLEGMTRESARPKERWQPYQRWMSTLSTRDAILTFNYDRVVELLNPTVGATGLAVRVFGADGRVAAEDIEDEARAAGLPLLYKLHGSVDWKLDGGRVKARDWNQSLLKDELAIATPGDTKLQMAGGVFRRIWSGAERVLRDAHEVNIVGFRFPPSDAHPRDHLLTALAANKNDQLTVNVVLGPENSADLRRVLALLAWTIGVKAKYDTDPGDNRDLIAHSMWAEDFLSVRALRRL